MSETTLLERIEQRMKELGLSARRVSLLASNGENAEVVRNIQRGKTLSPRGDTINGLAKALQCSADWLLTGSKSAAPNEAVFADMRVPAKRSMPRDLPVLGTAAGSASETDGAAQLTGGVVEYLRRPPALQGVSDAYVIYVVNDSMEPALPHGEAACVNPHRPAKPGDNVIVQVRGPDGVTYAYVKTLVRRTENDIICRQLNPPKEIRFSRADVVSVHRVMTVTDLISY